MLTRSSKRSSKPSSEDLLINSYHFYSEVRHAAMIKDFTILSKLGSQLLTQGEGAFSTVYRVRRNTDGQDYALKRVKMLKLSDKEQENALNEVRILASVRHPNIIAYKEAFFEDKSGSLW
jgi:NIMA (never in mitosis gene a)-related kinase